MYYRQIVCFLVILLTSVKATPQNIDVKSFKELPNDMDARVHEPVIDQNGEKCALIKVVTTEKGFVWEGGTLGITEVKNKAGEYWIYVPHGSQKITLKHDKLGVLRNYVYPVAIKKATVYEMELTTEGGGDPDIAAQWLAIQTEPDEASVFIDDKLAGTTPFQRKFEEGEYTYRIEKDRYHNKAGKITLKDEKKRLEFTLKPRFGNIQVTSSPEEGMNIYLDDENTGKKTPATLEEISSGEHTIELKSRWYQPQSKKVTVEDEQTTTADFNLNRAFANITVKTHPHADIFIDGEQESRGNWQGRLMEGIYTIKAEKEKYASQSEQLKVTAGQDETVRFDLKGKTGKADVVTTPMEAEVYLDGERQGTTPLTISDLLIGEYNLEIEKEGFGSVTETITIQEDETVTVEKQLPDAKEVTISSKISGADVYIDGNHVGETPYKGELGFGSKQVKLVNGKRTEQKNINITEGGKGRWEFELFEKQGTFTDERDGKTYKWLRIGGQILMAENLNYDQDSYGNDWCYESNSSNCDTYGRLYNWAAVMQGASSSNSNPSEVQGVCPDGWHVPSDKEWKELEMELGMSQSDVEDDGWRGTNEGSKLAGNASLWDSGDLTENSEFGASGFTALPGGDRDGGGSFHHIGNFGHWWSSTEHSSTNAWYRYLYCDRTYVYRLRSNKEHGYSVRCVRDD